MNSESISKKYYINPQKKTVRFIPEKNIEELIFNEHQWKKLFPITKTLDKTKYKNLKLTNIGKYSMANPHISEYLGQLLIDFIKKFNLDKNKITVTETNGGIGGLSIKLLTLINNLNIVEIHPTHANIIKNNLTIYGFGGKNKQKNVHIYNKDYLDVLYDLNQDIIISDPPWGGTNYGKYKYMKLGLNNINIVHIINRLYEKNKFKLFILLTPINFDVQNFMNHCKSKHIYFYNMGKHRYITVRGKML